MSSATSWGGPDLDISTSCMSSATSWGGPDLDISISSLATSTLAGPVSWSDLPSGEGGWGSSTIPPMLAVPDLDISTSCISCPIFSFMMALKASISPNLGPTLTILPGFILPSGLVPSISMCPIFPASPGIYVYLYPPAPDQLCSLS